MNVTFDEIFAVTVTDASDRYTFIPHGLPQGVDLAVCDVVLAGRSEDMCLVVMWAVWDVDDRRTVCVNKVRPEADGISSVVYSDTVFNVPDSGFGFAIADLARKCGMDI